MKKTKNTWGGKRKGAGRTATEVKRTTSFRANVEALETCLNDEKTDTPKVLNNALKKQAALINKRNLKKFMKL